jgi:hypothetical protein
MIRSFIPESVRLDLEWEVKPWHPRATNWRPRRVAMSLSYHALFLIEPRPDLAERLIGRVEADLAELLLQPVLIRRRESTGAEWPHVERLAQAKLLYLASISEYPPLDDPAGFEAVFGSARFSLALFDRWWVIRRLVVDEEWEDLEARLRDRLDRVEPTDQPQVDHWLSSL